MGGGERKGRGERKMRRGSGENILKGLWPRKNGRRKSGEIEEETLTWRRT